MKILEKSKKIDKYILESSNVFIVGHRYLDMDAIASNIGIAEYVKHLGKKPTIIVNDKRREAGVARVFEKLEKCYHIEKSSKAKLKINDASLLIISDTNKEQLLQDSTLANLFKKILIIDHHEYNETSILNAFAVVDDTSSSASEMVTYLLNSKEIKINKTVATVLLAGIVLDTNNFSLKTSTDTFKAAYLLSEQGADSGEVQRILKQNLKEFIERSKVITNVKLYNNIAISTAKSSIIYRREDLAKIGDILLQFNGIEIALVVGKLDPKTVGVSGRSEGRINVGDVLEYLGGGGNAYQAAAQVQGKKIREVEEELREILKKFK